MNLLMAMFHLWPSPFGFLFLAIIQLMWSHDTHNILLLSIGFVFLRKMAKDLWPQGAWSRVGHTSSLWPVMKKHWAKYCGGGRSPLYSAEDWKLHWYWCRKKGTCWLGRSRSSLAAGKQRCVRRELGEEIGRKHGGRYCQQMQSLWTYEAESFLFTKELGESWGAAVAVWSWGPQLVFRASLQEAAM